MMLEPYASGTVSYLSYPKGQIQFSMEDGILFLSIPAFLALEMYHSGILRQDNEAPVPISISGKKLGWFNLIKIIYMRTSQSPFDRVSITFVPIQNFKKELPERTDHDDQAQ